MYCIAVYDVGGKRTVRALKVMRRYLTWMQRSVFEGELTDKQISQMLAEMKPIVDGDGDSFILYLLADESWITRRQLGRKEDLRSNIL